MRVTYCACLLPGNGGGASLRPAQIASLQRAAQRAPLALMESDESAHLARQLGPLLKMHGDLQDFASLNFMAFYKILKRHDKSRASAVAVADA